MTLSHELREGHKRSPAYEGGHLLGDFCSSCPSRWPCPSTRAADRIDELERVIEAARVVLDNYDLDSQEGEPDPVGIADLRDALATTEQGAET